MPSFSEPEVRSWESTWRLFYLNIMGKLIVKNRYGTIPNDLLNSTKISFKAKGLFAYIQSKPDNWEFSAERISKQVKEGLPSIVSALKELENFGYLVRNRYQNNKGFWVVDYLLYEIPNEEILPIGNPIQENPNIGKPTNISNNEFSKKDINDSKLLNKQLKKNKQNQFEIFWSIYDKKIDKLKCEKIWINLKDEEIEKILNSVSEYVQANNDQKFRKYPSTYLHNKCFNDEIIIFKQQLNDGNSNNKQKGTSIDRMEALRNW